MIILYNCCRIGEWLHTGSHVVPIRWESCLLIIALRLRRMVACDGSDSLSFNLRAILDHLSFSNINLRRGVVRLEN